jgi:hypothetical protein
MEINHFEQRMNTRIQQSEERIMCKINQRLDREISLYKLLAEQQ